MKTLTRELRPSAAINTVREYIESQKKKLQAYDSMFTKNNPRETDEILTTFASYFAARVNSKIGTAIGAYEVSNWHFNEMVPWPSNLNITYSVTTIGQLSQLTFTELVEWLDAYDNRPTTAVL